MATFPTRLRTRLPTRQVPSVMYNFYAKKTTTKKKKNEQIFEINKCTRILRKTQIINTIMIHASQTRPSLLPPPPPTKTTTARTTTTITTTTTTTTVVRTT